MGTTLLGLAILSALTVLVGRLVSRAARVTWLDRSHPDVLPLHAALGTAVLTCVCATASHAGLGQRQVIACVALLCVALLTCDLRAGTPRRRVAPCRLSTWLPLTVAMVSAAVVGLLPIVWLHSFNTFNDAFFYNAIADWLVEHGVSEIAPRDSMLPALAIVSQFQEAGVRIGSCYLQAFLTAMTGASHALLVFYSVSCWGFILLAACAFSLGRRVFRLSPWVAAAAACTLVCTPAGSSHALQTGFQAQLYGLCVLLALLCVTARMLTRSSWTVGGCLVLGALLAWQASAYSELLPIAGIVLLVWLVITARLAGRLRQRQAWARSVAAIAVAFALFGNFEIVRAASGLPRQLGAVVGWHIDGGTGFWLALFTGTASYPPVRGANPLALLIGPISLLILCVSALMRNAIRHLMAGTAATIAVLVLLVLYFAFIARDPWSGTHPHTWSLYKLTEWLHPLIVVSAWAGVSRFLRGPRAARVAGAVGVLLVPAGLQVHARYAEMYSWRDMSLFSGSDQPLAELERLGESMAALSGQQLYVVTRPHLTNPRFVELLGYFSIHSRAAGLWSGATYIFSPWVSWMAPDRTDVVPTVEPLTLLCHQPHFEIPGARQLGCQVAAVAASDQPVLCQVANPNGLEWTDEGQPCAWIGGPPTILVVFVPHAGRLQLSFRIRLGPGLQPSTRQLQITSRGVMQTLTIDANALSGVETVRVTCEVAAGVNEIGLACTDPPDGAQPGQPDPGAHQLAFFEPHVSFD